MDVRRRIAENLASVRERIAAAAQGAGREPNDVTLVAVTKYVGIDLTAAVVDAGCTDLGESRPQELWTKADALSGRPVRWHLVGHLQRNKIRRTLPLVHRIHSVDSRRLLEALEEEAARLTHPVDVLLEANISGDITKTGLPPEELEPILADAPSWPHVAIRGLMGMAGLAGGCDAARREFDRLRTLRDRLAMNLPPNASLTELSMGMTNDFQVAIEAGATIVRIGGAVFEGLSG